jgi:hypothetical protein
MRPPCRTGLRRGSPVPGACVTSDPLCSSCLCIFMCFHGASVICLGNTADTVTSAYLDA